MKRLSPKSPIAALAALTLVLTGGCASDDGSSLAVSTGAWSTKSDSALGRDPTLARLPVPQAMNEQDLEELATSAEDLLLRASQSTNAMLRANAIEALHAAPERLPSVIERGLVDQNRGVRFVAAMTVGKLRMEQFAADVERLLEDDSDSVRAAAIYALHCLGRRPDPNPLARMIFSDVPEVKGNAAMVLGELGEPTAIRMLAAASRERAERIPLSRARIVELQIAEAMVRLGAEDGLQPIRAALFVPPEQGEQAVLACQMLGRLKDEAYLTSLLQMALRTGRAERPAEIRLAATQAVAQIDPSRAPAEVAHFYTGHDRYQIRAQAASTLGWCRADATAPFKLAAMLRDRNALVQVAAAGAILRLGREAPP
jgi:HEAT repeat protein